MLGCPGFLLVLVPIVVLVIHDVRGEDKVELLLRKVREGDRAVRRDIPRSPIPFSELADPSIGVVPLDVPQPKSKPPPPPPRDRSQYTTGRSPYSPASKSSSPSRSRSRPIVQTSDFARAQTDQTIETHSHHQPKQHHHKTLQQRLRGDWAPPAGSVQVIKDPRGRAASDQPQGPPTPLSTVEAPQFLSTVFPSPLNDIDPERVSSPRHHHHRHEADLLRHNFPPGAVPRPRTVSASLLPEMLVMAGESEASPTSERLGARIFQEERGGNEETNISYQRDGHHAPRSKIHTGSIQADKGNIIRLLKHRSNIEKIKSNEETREGETERQKKYVFRYHVDPSDQESRLYEVESKLALELLSRDS